MNGMVKCILHVGAVEHCQRATAGKHVWTSEQWMEAKTTSNDHDKPCQGQGTCVLLRTCQRKLAHAYVPSQLLKT